MSSSEPIVFNNPETYTFYHSPTSVELTPGTQYQVIRFDKDGDTILDYNYIAEFISQEESSFIFKVVEGVNIDIPSANDGQIKIVEDGDFAVKDIEEPPLKLHVKNATGNSVGTIVAFFYDSVDTVLEYIKLKFPQYKGKDLAMAFKGQRLPKDHPLFNLGIVNNSTIYIFFNLETGRGTKKRKNSKKRTKRVNRKNSKSKSRKSHLKKKRSTRK
jgi:hypothetical protein